MKNGRSAVCTLTWSWWRHQMETFSPLLALCVGNSPVPVNSPHQGQFSLICARINDWVNNREAGELRRHRGHYDVIVMEPWATLHWILETAFDYTFETDARMTLTFLIFLRSRDRFLSNYDFDRDQFSGQSKLQGLPTWGGYLKVNPREDRRVAHRRWPVFMRTVSLA